MDLQLYDTYTRSLRQFVPLHPGQVGMYACGPTVYDFAHIGNLRTYVFEDLLRRALELNGYTVRHVVNITDVGHLTTDADTGEDKMEAGSRRTGKSAWDIAAEYTAAFKDDLARLNILPPTVWCRATDHIKDQIEFVAELERKGFTYRTSDGIYFDTSMQPEYGRLACLNRAGMQAGKRVELGEKREPTDFALWKFSTPGEHRQMEWDSPWGLGFPGWHIECSAMSAVHLGEYFDIHCGGEDHVSIHHTNEIAQTEGRYGTRLANFWLHGAFLKLNEAKMSKSSGDFMRLQTLIDQNFDPLAYRYLCLTAHYRTQLNFSFESLDAAMAGLERLRQTAHRIPPSGAEPDAAFLGRFMAEVNDDLNYPRALAVAFEMLKSELPDAVKRATLLHFDSALGLGLEAWRPAVEVAPDAVQALMVERAAARAEKRWGDADQLRQRIHGLGWEVEDSKEGQKVRKL